MMRNQWLRLGLLSKKILEIAELTLKNLVLGTKGSVIEFQFIVFLEYTILRELQQILLSLLFLSGALGCFPIFGLSHGSNGVE